MPLATRPLTDRFGVEISGVDMAAALDPATAREIADLWYENGVVLFRGQDGLAEEAIVQFCRHFGELEIHVRKEYLSETNPELILISNVDEDGRRIGILGDHDVGWHHDQIYQRRPAVGSLLYAVELPAWGGNTAFANLAVAFEAMPDAMRARLDGLRAQHSYAFFNGQWSVPTDDEQTRLTPDVVHPLIRTHPVTGRKAIYADPGMTPAIDGLAADESRALLDEIFEWITRPEFVYEHAWAPGDALMWDNASTMHRRDAFDPASRRIMKRTTIMAPEDRAVPF
ncbi:MAG: TauD/TfdA family dioxygenase [Magnetovibrio sp.]|nr:TauD/TfdA family dioxygenase [Magnetovibrio sp.]